MDKREKANRLFFFVQSVIGRSRADTVGRKGWNGNLLIVKGIDMNMERHLYANAREEERDLAHEADMEQLRRQQLRDDIGDDELDHCPDDDWDDFNPAPTKEEIDAYWAEEEEWITRCEEERAANQENS